MISHSPTQPASHPPTPSGRRNFRAYLFTLGTILYLLPFMRLLIRGTDEGLFAYGAVRVVRGQVFARDFFEIAAPGTFYWLAGFFKVFGVSFATERLCLFLTSIGTAAVMYWLSRRICRHYALLPCILFAATAFGPIWPGISHHVDSNLWALLSVACMVLWLDRRANWILFAAGTLTGATTLFLLPKGALLLAAFIVWLLMLHGRSVASRRARIMACCREVGWLVAGYSAIICTVLAYFWSRHALWDLANADLLFPLKHYAAVNTVPYAQGILRDYWTRWTLPSLATRWTAIPAALLILPFVYVAALPLLLSIFGLRRRESFARPELSLFWLSGGAMWLAEYHRKDICHLVFGSPLLIILSIYYLSQFTSKLATPALQVLGISSCCLAVLNLLLALSAHTTMTRVGTVSVFKGDPSLEALDKRVTPGTEILIYPSEPMDYFLTGTINPIRWGGLMYNYNAPAEFMDLVRVLETHRVRYVLWNLDQEQALKDAFPSAHSPDPQDLIVEPYLESHYEVVWAQAGTRILERKRGADANQP